MAILIKADSLQGQHVCPKEGNVFSLEELQGYVGGYIELAPHVIGEDSSVEGLLIVVDEEGRLKNKPLNVMASAMCGQMLVGDVFLCLPDELD